MLRLVMIVVAALFGVSGSSPTSAEVQVVRHAIVVGVSGYDKKIIRPLRAPANDVRLIWDLLLERGFAPNDILVLADQLTGGATSPVKLAAPTHQNIVAAFENVTDAISKNKNKQHSVFIYFSGHGSRQPQFQLSDDVEPDNYDEVFLPLDVGPIDMETRKIKNGLVDDEIKILLEKLQSAGNVFVWVVFDACHAGDMTRGIDEDVQAKYIDTEALIPKTFRAQWRQDIAAAEEVSASMRKKDQNLAEQDGWLGKGRNKSSGITVFAAAQADKLALELPIAEADNEVYSVFTYHLVKAMRQGPHSSYRALADSIERQYAAFQAGLPSPVYEGALDRGVELARPGSATWRWPAQSGTSTNSVTAQLGALSGVREGSILALYDAGSTDQPSGYLKVTSAGLSHSTAVPIAHLEQPEPKLKELEGPITVSVAVRNIAFSLRVATQLENGDVAGKIATQAVKLVQDVSGTGSALNLEWVGASAPADVLLVKQSDRLVILPSTSSLDAKSTAGRFSVLLDGEPAQIAEKLTENLWRLTRQKNLLRIANAVSPADDKLPIDVRLFQIASPVSSSEQDDRHTCPDANMRELNEGGDLVDLAQPPTLKHCDVLRLEVTNTGEKPLQVTGLLVGSDASISVFDVGNRPIIKPGNILPAASFIQIVTWCALENCKRLGLQDGAQTTGRDRLILVVLELPDSGAPINLGYLAQPSLAKAKSMSQKGYRRESTELERLLGEATLIPKTRSVGVGSIKDATLKVLQWDTVR